MENIKFRAWDRKNQKMVGVKLIGGGYLWTDEHWIDSHHFDMANTAHEIGVTCDVMQYTGCKTKEGVDIYEGDIIQINRDGAIEEVITEVFYQNGAFIVDDDFGECDLMPIGWALEWWDGAGDTIEVIGNIYRTPNWRKQKEPIQ